MSDETYELEFVANAEEFAAGTKRVAAELNRVSKAAEAVNRAAARSASMAGRSEAAERAELRRKYENLSVTQKLIAMERQRRRLAMESMDLRTRGESLNPRRQRMLGALVSELQMLGAANPEQWSAARGFVYHGKPKPQESRPARGGRNSPVIPGDGPDTSGSFPMVAASVTGLIAGYLITKLARGLGSVIAETQDKSRLAQSEMAAMEKLLDWSEGARENVAEIANVWDTMILGIKKGVGETLGFLVSTAKVLIGGVESLAGQTLSMLPGAAGRAGKALQERGDAILTEGVGNLPKMLGGAGGMGYSAAIAAEDELKRVEERRLKREMTRREEARERRAVFQKRLEAAVAAFNDKQRTFAFGSDVSGLFGGGASAKAGLFASGNGFNADMLNIQRAIYRELQANTRVTERLGEKIAKDMETSMI